MKNKIFGLALIFILFTFLGACEGGSIPTAPITPAATGEPSDTGSTPVPTLSPNIEKPIKHIPSLPVNIPTLSPSPVPTNKPLTEREKQKIIADTIKNLAQGQIAYNTPEEMEIGESNIVDVSITASNTKDLETIPRSGKGSLKVEAIKVSSVMSAELTGAKFDIKPLFSQKEQLVTDENTATWQWEITPKEKGTQPLNLIVTLDIEIPGYEKKIPPYTHRVLSRNIKIKVNPMYSVSEFFKTNWQWLITTLIACGGFFAWIFNNHKKIKRSIHQTFIRFTQVRK